MYSNKENVNILTALLVAHDVRHAVVCPGSRNAPICHNLNECADIMCYPVTDERSAGFFALGVAQATDEAVAVCVTSGTALLNVLPAVAEAMYQHRPLVIISADRPAAFIDQLQGQTLPQTDALGRFVRKAVSLPEPHDEMERWHCNRLINEALIELWRGEGGPVHINVPISEPLFDFSVASLPSERVMTLHDANTDNYGLQAISDAFLAAKRPLILMGQVAPERIKYYDDDIEMLTNYAVVLREKLADDTDLASCLEEMLIQIEDEEEDYLPDFILYMGDTFVSKRLKAFLRKTDDVPTFLVNMDGAVHDVTTHVTHIVVSPVGAVVSMLAHQIENLVPTAYHDQWESLYLMASSHVHYYDPDYSQLLAVRELCIASYDADCVYQFANSTAVRLGNIWSMRYIYCNRGVNGIEGSLSTAVGFAAATDKLVFCVIGDLSFFYDQNALWNRNLTPNLRILLLNNGGGGIFQTLPGLKQSPARNSIIAAEHHTTAEGICQENNVSYIAVHNDEQLEDAIDALIVPDAMAPMLMEVFTDAEEDKRVLDDYYYGDMKQLN